MIRNLLFRCLEFDPYHGPQHRKSRAGLERFDAYDELKIYINHNLHQGPQEKKDLHLWRLVRSSRSGSNSNSGARAGSREKLICTQGPASRGEYSHQTESELNCAACEKKEPRRTFRRHWAPFERFRSEFRQEDEAQLLERERRGELSSDCTRNPHQRLCLVLWPAHRLRFRFAQLDWYDPSSCSGVAAVFLLSAFCIVLSAFASPSPDDDMHESGCLTPRCLPRLCQGFTSEL